MAHSRTYEAIVLKAYDVGEADRFLILFTRERGRLAARARGVRKLKSRMGGHLLPLQHITVTMTEGRAGLLVTAAQRLSPPLTPAFKPFLHVEEGIEALTHLLHDEEALPDVFELTLKFLSACHQSDVNPTLPYLLGLLSLLGLLPDASTLSLSGEDEAYMLNCLRGAWNQASERTQKKLSTLCNEMILEQTSYALRTPQVAAALEHD